MRLRLLSVLFVLLVSAVGYGQQTTAFAPDAIFVNGKVVTVDGRFGIQQAFALKGETFAAVGDNRAIRALARAGTRTIDLRGATVIPGLTDSHSHLYHTARLMLTGIRMDGAATVPEVLERIRQGVATARPGETVYTSVLRPGQPSPTRADLDGISRDVPIVVLRGRRGAAMFNSAALARAGISRENATFAGAAMPTDASGELTGANPPYPAGMTLIDRLLPPLTEAEEDAFVLKAVEQRHAWGLTSIRDLSLFPDGMRTYMRLRQQGRLALRVSMALDLPDPATVEQTLSLWGVSSGFGDEWLRLDTISEDPFPPVADARQMTALALTANRYGWRLAPHTGADDGSVGVTLDAYEAADRVASIKSKRWVIEHAPSASAAEMDRMKALGVVVSAAYGLYGANIAPTLDAAARARLERQTPMREFLDKGLIVSAGSDFLNAVALDDNPLVPFYFYVTRKTRTGQVVGPHEKITREEALRVSTINYAYTTFEETLKGSIEVGKLADFLILSDDILSVPEDRILSIRPLATYVGGRRVFAAAGSGF